MPVKHLTGPEAAAAIAAGGAVALDCYATWCGPCKMVAPKFESMSDEASLAAVNFIKIDVDECEDFAEGLKIEAMPTFIFFKGGVEVNRVVGANVDAIRAGAAGVA